MKKTLSLLAVLIMATAVYGQRMIGASDNSQNSVTNSYHKFGRLLTLINAYYVDSTNINKLTEKAIISTLKNLDPHSTYLSADDVKAANEPLEGNFEGIGVEFNILDDTLTVVNPIAGGPSEAVGIRAADRILKVDEMNIAGVGLKNDQVYKLLRGPKGTKVVLTIMRKGTPGPLRFVVERDKIPIHSLDAAYEAAPGIVYLRLGRFSLTSLDEMQEAMNKFKQAPTAMILDLRGNSGGGLKTAIDLCDQFLDEGRIMVYNEGLNFPKRVDISTKDGFFKNGKLVVLVDEGSASASEIVSGAIQDWDRGILIGRRTYGKGLVQQLLPLTDGSQIRLTVARYHTPTGRVIQRPYNAGEIDRYYEDLYTRYTNGEVYNRDSIRFPDSLKYFTLVNKRTVYGGGGIMPDIFMPHDTASYTSYYAQISRAGLFNQFIVKYMDTQRETLKRKYKKFADFDKRFTVTGELFEAFVAFTETQGIARDNDALKISGNDMQLLLKALIARTLWSTSEYFETLNKHIDKGFIKAVDVINNWDQYEQEYLKGR